MDDNNKVILLEGYHWKDIENQIKEQTKKEDFQLQDLKDYLLDEGLMIFNKKTARLRFVGKFRTKIGDQTFEFYVFPKYMEPDSSQVQKSMPLILRAIEKTGHMGDYGQADFSEYRYQPKKREIGRYELAKWIVEDYCTNGIYYVREKRYNRSGKGRIKWNRTIDRLTPWIDGDDILYANPISVYTNKNDTQLLSEIHKAVVKEALDCLQKDFHEKNDVTEPEYDASLLSHLKQYTGVVVKCQRRVFLVREISLLRALETWCAEESRYYNLPYGTVSFELVWEDCLRMVFGHDKLPKKFSFGGIKYYLQDNNKQDNNLTAYSLASDSIPDVINVGTWDGEGNINFILLDGKYYLGQIKSSNSIDDLPGYKDIAKQIDYKLTLRQKYGLKQQYGVNAIVLPWYDIEGQGEIKIIKIENNLGHLRCANRDVIRCLGYVGKNKDEDGDALIALLKEMPVVKENQKSQGQKIQLKKILSKEDWEGVMVVQIAPEWLYRQMVGGTPDKKDTVEALWEFLRACEKKLKESRIISKS